MPSQDSWCCYTIPLSSLLGWIKRRLDLIRAADLSQVSVIHEILVDSFTSGAVADVGDVKGSLTSGLDVSCMAAGGKLEEVKLVDTL